ncbi:hypothetical protein BD770DRAFT_413257 [Pilaira anomala]|nr:hypothetical protein BD770DRAFT_413257 [Pilaira anomala]
MAVFPQEVLNLIFFYLSTRDLLHCQLVNSIWNEASVRLLYSDICLNLVQTELYIRTISNSSRLSSYLKYIDFGWQLTTIRNNEVWKKDRLLSIILQHCPNILKLHAYNPSPEIWTRLMYASKEGQLTHLQCLPIHTTARQIDSYAYATLFFKDTLTTLLLCDDKTNDITTNWANSVGCQTVLSYITEFRHLQHLSVGSHTSQPLDSFDALIEDCRHLKSFSVRLYPVTQSETEEKTNRTIYPRHGVHKLTCDWEIIKGDDQLKYIMLKFPSLQDLNILFDPFITDVSLQRREPRATSFKIITEFLHYAFDIPKLVFEFYLDKDDLIHVWTQFMKKNDKHRKMGISYIPNYHDPSKIVMHVKEGISKIMFPLKDNDLSLPHVDFLAANGNLIQSLAIESMWEAQAALKPTSTIYDRLKKEDWIHRILQLCPFLQELTFSNPNSMLISENVSFQHREIKKFAFDIFRPEMSFGFLKCLSLNLPNLKQLQFGFHDWFELDDFYCIKIDMPYTKFDLITCTEILRQEDTEYYIRLKTLVAEKLFVVDQDQLLLTISAEQEPIGKKKSSSKQLYFDITCQQLNEFKSSVVMQLLCDTCNENSLSNEILELIFSPLEQRDLSQCQLTCKKWYQVAVILLYSHVRMPLGFSYSRYCNTIREIPLFAERLKYFDLVYDDITKYQVTEPFEATVLDVLLKNCPNIVELNYPCPSVDFWYRLVEAASQHKLQRLRSLPRPGHKTLIWYNCAAMIFSKSLTLLSLDEEIEEDESSSVNGSSNCLASYQSLCNNIHVFSNLEHLSIGYCSDKLISQWNIVIDSVPYLKSLTFISSNIVQKKVVTQFNGPIPRISNNQTLKCHWNIVKCDDQLKYIMYKFPNLKYLEILYETYFNDDGYLRSGTLSLNTLVTFLRYTLAIPKRRISFGIPKVYSLNIVTECTKMLHGRRSFIVKYVDHLIFPELVTLQLKNDSLEVVYVLDEIDNVLPHTLWLSKLGSYIKSVTINNELLDISIFNISGNVSKL